MKLNLRSFAVPPLLSNGAKTAIAAVVVTAMGAVWSGTKHASHVAVAHAHEAMVLEPQPPAVTSHATAASSCAAGQAAGG